jgi:hypothetical protein
VLISVVIRLLFDAFILDGSLDKSVINLNLRFIILLGAQLAIEGARIGLKRRVDWIIVWVKGKIGLDWI